MKYFFLLTFLFFTNCRYLPPIGEKYKKPETKMPAAWDSVKKDENSEFGEIKSDGKLPKVSEDESDVLDSATKGAPSSTVRLSCQIPLKLGQNYKFTQV